MKDEGREGVERQFRSVFAAAHTVIAEAPGRINLIGEHTDYNGGMVLPTVLARSVQVAIGSAGLSEDQIYSTNFDSMTSRRIGGSKTGEWSDYAAGALAKARALGLMDGPVNMVISSTLPSGAGVSSSAALVTAILRAACKTSDVELAPLELAKAARAVENEYIGVPCGIMDQMAVGLAMPNQAIAIDGATNEYEMITIPDDFAFVTLHSGIRRELSDGRYKRRFEECQEARRALDVEHLCLVEEAKREQIQYLAEPLNARARHVVSEHMRTLAACQALKTANIGWFGELMNESHRSYARDFQASTPEIDAVVKSARDLGAIGARLTGGGFGGCITALLQPDLAEKWINEITARHPDTVLV